MCCNYNNVAPMSLDPFLEAESNTIIHYTVYPNMKVTRNTYAEGRQVGSMETGEYIFFESDQKYLYVNHEMCRSRYALNNVTGNYLPKMACFRAHTPVYGPWPEKCCEDYLFKRRSVLMQKLSKLCDEQTESDNGEPMET